MSASRLLEGLRRHQSGGFEQAEAIYRELLAQRPDCADALNLLGVLCCQRGRAPEALPYLERAVQLQPQNAIFQNNLGLALLALARSREAETCFRRALELDPNYAEAHNNLGNLLLGRGETEAAIACYREALRLRPDYARARSNLGNALWRQGQLCEAEACYRQALRLEAASSQMLSNLGGVLAAEGRVEEALRCFAQALELRLDDHRAHSNLLMCLHYDPNRTAEEIFAEHLRWRRLHAADLERRAQRPRLGRRGGKLRLGYVSADFRRHAVASLLAPVLEAHDRREFEIYCYADVAEPDSMTERLMGLADRWRRICGLSDEAVAEQIREDGIQILVDLAGHTGQNRLLAFARKPAPVQATWLGYPDTTGLGTMDYRITDAVADPPGLTERRHTESLMRLPRGFVCCGSPEGAEAASESNKKDGICFGAFHSLAKLNRRLLGWYAAILARTPGSRLLVKAAGLTDAALARRLSEEFEELGLSPERVELVGPAPWSRRLAVYERVDLVLDAFPYNGTTTSCEALWMGVPVVTLAGSTHVSRVGASLLERAGLGELVARSPEEFIELAACLARDAGELSGLRRRLRRDLAESVLADVTGFTRDLEEAYRRMWERLGG